MPSLFGRSALNSQESEGSFVLPQKHEGRDIFFALSALFSPQNENYQPLQGLKIATDIVTIATKTLNSATRNSTKPNKQNKQKILECRSWSKFFVQSQRHVLIEIKFDQRITLRRGGLVLNGYSPCSMPSHCTISDMKYERCSRSWLN